MKELEEKVNQWAIDKGIFENATLEAQVDKVREEALEVKRAKMLFTERDVKIEVGDVFFASIVLAQMLDVDIEECLSMAIEKNKNRTGKFINGSFVKDEY